LIAAYMAFFVINCPQEAILIGDKTEGQIVLPVPHLKERYS
jgi:predicted RNase H-like nuclease